MSDYISEVDILQEIEILTQINKTLEYQIYLNKHKIDRLENSLAHIAYKEKKDNECTKYI